MPKVARWHLVKCVKPHTTFATIILGGEDNMVEKTQVIEAMQKFSQELNRVHGNSQTAQFVSESLAELQKSEGVAFTGALQYFLNRVPVVKLSDSIEFNEVEKKSWHEVRSFNDLGNNLWGARL